MDPLSWVFLVLGNSRSFVTFPDFPSGGPLCSFCSSVPFFLLPICPMIFRIFSSSPYDVNSTGVLLPSVTLASFGISVTRGFSAALTHFLRGSLISEEVQVWVFFFLFSAPPSRFLTSFAPALPSIPRTSPLLSESEQG